MISKTAVAKIKEFRHLTMSQHAGKKEN